jgi:hypothetical protein
MKLNGVRNIYMLGDLHFGVKSNSIEWFNIQKSFLIDWFISQLKEDGFDPSCDILMQAGDWNHSRESVNVRLSNSSLDIFNILSRTFKKGIHIILGNHDVYYKDRNDVHSLREVDIIYDNIKIYEKPELLTINDKHRFLMLPWEHDNSILSETVSKYQGKADYVLCHADIKDFRLNKWTKLESGLSRSSLSNFKKIYSGHIHIRQSYKNMTYIGTPFHLDRGDVGNIKGYYKLNVESDTIVETFHENTYSPNFVKYDAVDILNKSISDVKSLFNNNYVDILIDNNIAKSFPVTQFLDLVKNSGYRHIEFFPYSSSNSKKENTHDIQDNSEYNIFDVLNEYLKIREMPDRLLSKVSSKFKDIYQDVKNSKNTYE